MNKVILTGRLVADPELKTAPNGVALTTFRIAVDRSYVKNGEERKSDFFNVIAWQKTADFICKYFHKGDGINLVGNLQSRQYEAKDGTNRYVVEIIAENVEFPLSRKSDNGTYQNTYAPTAQTPQTASSVSNADYHQFPIDDDLPF